MQLHRSNFLPRSVYKSAPFLTCRSELYRLCHTYTGCKINFFSRSPPVAKQWPQPCQYGRHYIVHRPCSIWKMYRIATAGSWEYALQVTCTLSWALDQQQCTMRQISWAMYQAVFIEICPQVCSVCTWWSCSLYWSDSVQTLQTKLTKLLLP